MPTKQVPIKAIINFRKMTPEVLLSTSTNICTEVFKNLAFIPPQAPAPPVDEATLKAANDALAAANAAAVDGGKKATAARNHAKEVVVKLLVQLAHHVEANCKDDMPTFISSGFTPVTKTKTKTPAVSDSFKTLVAGPNAGEMQGTLIKDPDAAAYVIQWGAVPAGGGSPTVWQSQAVGSVIRKPFVITGLTPATTYVFQVRALKKGGGYSDWSNPITRVAT